jgi:pimeloyl-ACP methyl ester carboxylesterase
MDLTKYEDTERRAKCPQEEQFSPFLDFRYVQSTVTPEVTFAVRIIKPCKPSYILAGTHGWHMSIRPFEHRDSSDSEYLVVDVDMRGRAFSTGTPDCNGYELYDVYDAVNFVRREYSDYLIDGDVVYFESGSGGGGNALALAGKFPDLFSAVNALSPIADYERWYQQDSEYKEFRDEMDIWIHNDPRNHKEAYASRSGITVVENVLSSILIYHGGSDLRVSCELSRAYKQKADMCGKGGSVALRILQNVGTRDHFGNISKEQLTAMKADCLENLRRNKSPVFIPNAGRFVVAGYLVTKAFSIFLDTVDRVAHIKYDIDTREISGGVPMRVVWHV